MKTMGLNRRAFLKTVSAGAAGVALAGRSFAEMDDAALKAARHAARKRTRRMIMNNDGNELHRLPADEVVTPELFLSKRTTPLIGSQVDAVFYCTGVFNYYTHRTKVADALRNPELATGRAYELHDLGTDALEVITDFCHAHDMETFWSMRMNDTHDSGNPDLFCPWKEEHPEYLVGKKQKLAYPFGCNRWSSVDYGVPEVREQVFRIFEEVCTNYDIDGIEMDFFRHPVLFKAQMTGKPVTQEQCDQMTGLVQRVRRMADAVGKKRGRPILMGVRIPDSVGYCKELGIDLVRWLEEDLIDLVAGAGYFKLEPWETFADLCHEHGVPYYACLVSRRIMGGGEPEAGTEIQVWRGEAWNAWQAGVDGIYTFNRFNPKDAIFRELGDPAVLRDLPRKDQTTYVAPIWSRPEKWLKNGDRFVNGPK